jgi:alkanesulfonate monooxygenase SsuD/methylene tetrahydromethanopterin reductase-like flavin-dependent oxidoreductase (luciferase family)
MKTRFGLLHLFESAIGKTEAEFFAENLQMAEHAEEIGLDSVWLAEHHFTDYGVMPSTQVLGSFLAGRTQRIRIGTGVVVLPFHNPIRVAEEFAFLDVLSGGRLDFGVGRGYQPGEFEGYGIPFEESRSRFDESLKIIRQAWTQDTVEFQGEHFTFQGIRPRPRPLQTPHPPIFGASFNPETIKYQAMKDLNLLFTPLTTMPDKIHEYRAILSERGHNPDDFRIGGLAFVYVNEDGEKALADFEEPCMEYFRTFAQLIPASKYRSGDYYASLHHLLNSTLRAYDEGSVTFEWMVKESPFKHAFLVGDTAYVSKKLQVMLSEYPGLSDVLCWTRLGGLDHRKVMASMECFMDQIVRPLRARQAQADSGLDLTDDTLPSRDAPPPDKRPAS